MYVVVCRSSEPPEGSQTLIWMEVVDYHRCYMVINYVHQDAERGIKQFFYIVL